MLCFVPHVIVPKHVDIKPSEDGQLTETCKGSKYIRIESKLLFCNLMDMIITVAAYTVNPRYNGPGYNGQNLASC
jgi:hypothetical protein